jgi:hypothetical protein
MTGPVTVTQADREALWQDDQIERLVDEGFKRVSRNPSDYETAVAYRYAIARARIEGAKMALEAAAKVADQRAIAQQALKRPEDWPEGAWNARQVGTCNALELTATAIRQTDPAQIVKGQSDGR